jgi:hypothetical protein
MTTRANSSSDQPSLQFDRKNLIENAQNQNFLTTLNDSISTPSDLANQPKGDSILQNLWQTIKKTAEDSYFVAKKTDVFIQKNQPSVTAFIISNTIACTVFGNALGVAAGGVFEFGVGAAPGGLAGALTGVITGAVFGVAAKVIVTSRLLPAITGTGYFITSLGYQAVNSVIHTAYSHCCAQRAIKKITSATDSISLTTALNEIHPKTFKHSRVKSAFENQLRTDPVISLTPTLFTAWAKKVPVAPLSYYGAIEGLY